MNVGIVDRVLRALLSATLLYLGLFLYANSALGIGLAIAGGVFLLTALVGLCPLYSLLGLRTCPVKDPLA